MALSLRHMRAFVAVGEQLSFINASRLLNVTQPALTRTIRELEAAIGTALLIRTTRSVRLTPAGELFLIEARSTLLQAEHSVRVARHAGEGLSERLRIGYMDFAIHGPLMQALTTLRSQRPGMRAALRRERSENQSSMVAANRLDVGITIQHAFQPGLTITPLTSNPLCVLMPDGHPLSRFERVPLEALREENFVLGEPAIWYQYLRIVHDFCSRQHFIPRIVMEAYESPTLFELVRNGFGITIYSSIVASRDLPGIQVRPFIEDAPVINTYAISRRTEENEAIRALLRIIAELAEKRSR